jgi:hypothetical protein
MDAVRADQYIGPGMRSVGKVDPNAVTVVDGTDAAPSKLDGAGRQRIEQQLLELGPVQWVGVLGSVGSVPSGQRLVLPGLHRPA